MKVKISEGLGEGCDTWYQSREGGLLLSIRMAGEESKEAKLHETPVKKSRKCKPLKASFGLVEAQAPEPLEELEPEPKVPDEVQDSPVPSQGDPASNFAEGESSQAPSAAPPVAAP